jgi:hypothetical protein
MEKMARTEKILAIKVIVATLSGPKNALPMNLLCPFHVRVRLTAD